MRKRDKIDPVIQKRTRLASIKWNVSRLIYEEKRIEYLKNKFKEIDPECFDCPPAPKSISLELDDHEIHFIAQRIHKLIAGKESLIKNIENELLNNGEGDTNKNNQG